MHAPDQRHRGSLLLETIVSLGILAALLALLTVLSRSLIELNERHRTTAARAIAAALVDAARALPPGQRILQTDGPPLGMLVGSGHWERISGRCALTERDGDGMGILPFPGDVRDDGTLILELGPLPSDADATVLVRAHDRANTYGIAVRNDRIAIVRVQDSTRIELASAPLAASPRTISTTLAGSSIRVEADAAVLAATDAAFPVGWNALIANADIAFTRATWNDAQGSTTWDCAGDGPLAAPWAAITTWPLRRAHAGLTVEARADPPGTRAITGIVTWTSLRGTETERAYAVVAAP